MSNARICRATLIDDDGNVDQRFHVVHHRRLAEEPGLCGKRRLIARLAAMPFNRIEQRGLFTADVSARAAAELDLEIHAAAKNVLPQKTFPARGLNGVRKTLRRQRIFATQDRCNRCSAPVTSAAMVMPSRTANGSPSMTSRSLKVPGSDSSALQIR